MEDYIKLGVQILFLLATIVFVIYSVIGIYTLNKYGQSKTLTMGMSILYACAVIALMSWGWVILGTI